MNTHRLSQLSALPLLTASITASLALGACSSSSSQPQSAADVAKQQSEVEQRLDAATDVVGQLRPNMPDYVAGKSRCMVVIPALQKGGLIVGGMGGKGFATCASGGAWSPPAPVTMGGGTVGAQVGYQSAKVLALIVSDSAVKALEAGNFKIGGTATATAGPAGASSSATGDVGVKSDILTYSDAAGLFAGATLDGMTVSSDDDATRALYGTQADLASLLERQATLPRHPASVERFLAAVNHGFSHAVSLGEQRAVTPIAEER